MTCVIGFVKGKKVYIGGDSAGVAGLDIITRKDAKVFKKGRFVFGYTTSFRMGQLIRYKLKLPSHPKGMGDFEFMCTRFIDSIRGCLKIGGFTNINNNVEEGGKFLVGYKGNLYTIENDFQVGISAHSYDAVGCGESYALGALKALEVASNPPEKKIKMALEIAEEFSAGVRRPFVVVNT